MTEKRWHAIAKRCPKDRPIIGAEIGVYKGKNARNLLNILPNLSLYLIDRWIEYNQFEIKSDEASTMGFIKQERWEKIYSKVLKLQRRQGESRVKILREDSRIAAERFKNEFFDFVFIDANHGYNDVFIDIALWITKIKKGGFICGHDYSRLTVFDAVNDFFKDIRVETDVDKTWFVRIL